MPEPAETPETLGYHLFVWEPLAESKPPMEGYRGFFKRISEAMQDHETFRQGRFACYYAQIAEVQADGSLRLVLAWDPSVKTTSSWRTCDDRQPPW